MIETPKIQKMTKVKTIDDIDAIFLDTRNCSDIKLPIIACFFTGPIPKYSAPMLRTPEPQTGIPFGENFAELVKRTVKVNEAVHDGAIMIGRNKINENYNIVGWSFRLFPPDWHHSSPNRGSAFNSCLAMSKLVNVDRIYLVSREGVYRFEPLKLAELDPQ